MNETEVKQLIADTVNATVSKMQAAGLLRDNRTTAIEKTEALLRQYPALKGVDEPYAQRVVREIDACMEEIQNDPYADVIRLFYFGGLKNAACADVLCCDERTARRNRKQFVQQFSARLASDEFIRDLLK